MSYYRKKPVVIEAMQWDGTWDSMDTINARWPEMRTTHLSAHPPSRTVREWGIGTLEGYHQVSVGDFVIKGVKGEFYPCKPDIFAMTYESAEQAPQPAELTDDEIYAVADSCDVLHGKKISYRDARCFARAVLAAQARAALQAELVKQQAGYIQMLNTLRAECSGHIDQIIRLQAELAAAKAAPEQSEPVAYMNQNGVVHEAGYEWFGFNNHLTPLYTHPAPQPKAEPVNQMLLDVLKSVIAWMDAPEDSAFSDSQLAEARAAIAKAEQAPQPAELTDEEIDEITAHCHDGKAYPMDAMMLPVLLRRVEARAVLAAQRAKTK